MGQRPAPKGRNNPEPEGQRMEPSGRGRNLRVTDVGDADALALQPHQEFEVFGEMNLFAETAGLQKQIAVAIEHVRVDTEEALAPLDQAKEATVEPVGGVGHDLDAARR